MDVANMTGKTVVITGGNSGIGLETAVALAGAGAHTIITARDQDRGQLAVADIKHRSASSLVDLVIFDLASLDSVRAGAAVLLERWASLDVLVNNAGVVLSTRTETVDGFESTFAINHLGPFLLTELLLARLQQGAPSRVVNVASTAHTQARSGLDFSDLEATRRYGAMSVYARSKLANILFTTELARRLAGTGVTVNCLHPGVVATGYGRDGDTSGILSIGLKAMRPFILSPARGAETTVYLASSPEVADTSGKYFIKCKEHRTSAAARDPETARKLFEVSEQLVGLTPTT